MDYESFNEGNRLFFSNDGELMETHGPGDETWDEPSPLILMQFTGLKDKNGKDIYEGDIVRDIDGGPAYRIEYNPPYFAMYRHADGYSENAEYENMMAEGYELEVIGNIYENPELLGVK